MSSAILFRTHFYTPQILREFKKLERECAFYDVINLHDTSREKVAPEISSSFEISSDKILKQYSNFVSLWENGHYPLLSFYKSAPHYEYYWMVEYDVRFTGNWLDFIDSFKNDSCDLLASHLRSYDDETTYVHWNKLTNYSVPIKKQIYTFFPLLRFSNRALQALHEAHSSGVGGYCEVVVPTYLFHKGMQLGNFNGRRMPGPDSEKKYWFNNSSFVYKPCFIRPGLRADTLYHPVLEHKNKIEYLQELKEYHWNRNLKVKLGHFKRSLKRMILKSPDKAK